MSELFNIPQIIGMPNEWYTPAKYIEAARQVMGGIDLDPASCELANKTVRATMYYTKEDDGLIQSWNYNGRPSRIWLNPPYGKIKSHNNEGRSYIGLFIRKLVREYNFGNISQAILLATAQTDASWYHLLCENYYICFAREHVKFDCSGQTKRRDGKATHRLGTIFVYLGPDEQNFIDIFYQFGTISHSVKPSYQKPITPTLWDATINPTEEVGGAA